MIQSNGISSASNAKNVQARNRAPSVPVISILIENNMSQSNGMSSSSNATNDSAPIDLWKRHKCSKINDNFTKGMEEHMLLI